MRAILISTLLLICAFEGRSGFANTVELRCHHPELAKIEKKLIRESHYAFNIASAQGETIREFSDIQSEAADRGILINAGLLVFTGIDSLLERGVAQVILQASRRVSLRLFSRAGVTLSEGLSTSAISRISALLANVSKQATQISGLSKILALYERSIGKFPLAQKGVKAFINIKGRTETILIADEINIKLSEKTKSTLDRITHDLRFEREIEFQKMTAHDLAQALDARMRSLDKFTWSLLNEVSSVQKSLPKDHPVLEALSFGTSQVGYVGSLQEIAVANQDIWILRAVYLSKKLTQLRGLCSI